MIIQVIQVSTRKWINHLLDEIQNSQHGNKRNVVMQPVSQENV